MALPHAQLLDVINVGPLGDQLDGTVSTSLIKTEQTQLLHLVLADGQDMPQHHVDQECVIHCLEGDVEVVTGSGVKRLRAGQLVVLPARQQHGLRARATSAVLLTLFLRGGDAGAGGGAGRRRHRHAGAALNAGVWPARGESTGPAGACSARSPWGGRRRPPGPPTAAAPTGCSRG